jgi:hypothetical protein
MPRPRRELQRVRGARHDGTGRPASSWSRAAEEGSGPVTGKQATQEGGQETVKCYHRTFAHEEILSDGFRDDTATCGMGGPPLTGVWFSDRPLDANEGAEGDVLFAVEIPDDAFTKHEVVEEGRGYREAIIPAELVNRSGPPTVEDCDYAYQGKAALLDRAAMLEKYGNAYQAGRIRILVPFLERLGILEPLE